MFFQKFAKQIMKFINTSEYKTHHRKYNQSQLFNKSINNNNKEKTIENK